MSSLDKIITVAAQGHPDSAANVKNKVVIDVEKHCLTGKPHPTPDPGEIVYYLVTIDEHKYEVKEAHQTGSSLLTLAGKTAVEFLLEQVRTQHGQPSFKVVALDDKINLTEFGIEKFVTKPKPKPRVYHFFIGQKRYETTAARLTVRQILVDFAHLDPAMKTLAVKQHGGFHEYKDLNEEIDLEHPQHFILFDNTSTPVS